MRSSPAPLFSALRHTCKKLLTALTCLILTASPALLNAGEPGEDIPNRVFLPINDVEGLPRVLLIGDSISIGYTLPVRELLKDTANLHRIPENGGNSRKGVSKLDAWLGEGKWDVIHFNFGLHDIVRRDGKTAISAEEYERNLRKIISRLQQTGATLIWCSTTPVPNARLKRERHDSDVAAYNAIALKVMEENGIQVNDLYAFALPQLETIQNPRDVHYSTEGSTVLATQVSDSIRSALKN